jgi:hypothetical protein
MGASPPPAVAVLADAVMTLGLAHCRPGALGGGETGPTPTPVEEATPTFAIPTPVPDIFGADLSAPGCARGTDGAARGPFIEGTCCAVGGQARDPGQRPRR